MLYNALLNIMLSIGKSKMTDVLKTPYLVIGLGLHTFLIWPAKSGGPRVAANFTAVARG